MIQIRSQAGEFGNKVLHTRHSIIFPEHDLVLPKHRNVLALLRRDDAERAILIPASNIVTNDGDLFYAQLTAGEATTNTFTTHELGSAGTPAKGANRSAFTPIASTQKVQAATYPKTNDADADNTGAGVDIRTTLASYAKARFQQADFGLPYSAPTFNEFVVRVPDLPARHASLVERGILPGLPLGELDPERGDQILVCTTEMNTRDEIDRVVRELAA